MKLKDLKKVLDKLTPKQLEGSLYYNSEELSVSGIAEIKKAKANLYFNGDDDPSQLFTRKQLIENGFDSEEIKEMDIEIPKGAFFISF